MRVLEKFIENYKNTFIKEEPLFDASLVGKIQKSRHLFLSDEMSASKELYEKFDRLHARAVEPMKVAITGQFSSGKSTFLNALLSKDILPTGITPVTSKVNYIRYGDAFKIRLRYKDGRDEYQNPENIANFTDQRKTIEEVDYLTLYAPLELLKDIIFVDTPGLNSQAQSDTATTQKVLQEVDGIIWLSLIDNAGKMSEAKVLKEYLQDYQGKSLCVLNQKDKFTQEEVTQSVAYVQKSFAQFFAKVIPISAKEALESRSHDKNMLLEEAKEEFSKSIATSMQEDNRQNAIDLIDRYTQKMQEIRSKDLSQNITLMKSSNIDAVLDFIYKEIQPVAKSSKEFSINKELKVIADAISSQHELFMQIYDKLADELASFEKEADEKLAELKARFTKKLQDAYGRIEDIIDTIAASIFEHIYQDQRLRYSEKNTGILKSKVVYEAIEYSAPKIDADALYKKLFYDDEVVHKMFKKYVRHLGAIQDEVNENNKLVYTLLEKRIQKWQSPYEYIRKPELLYSDIEFANIRKFASKAYENILKPYSDQIHSSYAKISSQFNHLSSAVSFNYQNATEVSLAFIQQKTEQSIKLYEENPTKFSVYQPKLPEIKERLKISFHLYELQNMMDTNRTFLSKNYNELSSAFKEISADRYSFIQQRKARHKRLIEKIDLHVKEI